MSLMEGSCQCGDVQFKINGAPLLVAACYCRDCHKVGGGVTNSTVIFEESFELVSGNLSVWEKQCDHGASKKLHFCSTCNSRIYNISSENENIYRVVTGTLSNVTELVPQVHLWTSRKLPWLTIPESSAQFETEPDSPDEMFAAIQSAENSQNKGNPMQ